LTVDIKPPDLETRIAILRMMASMSHSNIPNDVLDLIAERFTENIRELEGALTRVTAVASLSNQPVSRALAEQTLQDFFTSECGDQAHRHHRPGGQVLPSDLR
jgi:chromosomal replication initiator protein